MKVKEQVVKTIEPFDMCNDRLFKSIFRSIEARKVVINFLSAITGIEKERLEKAEIHGGDIAKTKVTEKAKASDVMVKLNEQEKIIVEINDYYNSNQFEKNTEYAFSVIVESTKSKKKYSKIILINIDNFNKFKTKKPILHFKLRDEDGNIENESYNSIHLILDNCVNKLYNQNIDEEIIKFSKFLKTTTLDDMKKVFKGDEDYMAAVRKVEDLSTDPEFIGYYDVEEAHKQEVEDAYDSGTQIGFEKGISQRNIEIAKNMLLKDIDLNTISECTDLSIDEIESLK